MEIPENGEKKRMLDFDYITNDVLVAMQDTRNFYKYRPKSVRFESQ